jgi:hypothetical protein
VNIIADGTGKNEGQELTMERIVAHKHVNTTYISYGPMGAGARARAIK